MAREHIITGIDIGSRYIYTVITAFNPDAPVPKVIGVGKVASEGIRKGLVTNISEAASAVLRSVQEAERYAGVSASSAFVSVGGSHIVSQQSKGSIAVSRAEGEISENDIDYQGFVLSPLAASKAVLSRQQREVGVLCLDMGAGTTNLAVHENGRLIYANVLPIGGD